MNNFAFNLFTVKKGEKSPSFTKETTADYVGSTQAEGVTNILGRKAAAQSGLIYIKLRVSMNNKVHFGALFKNEKKESGSQPDFTGSLDLDDTGENRLRLAAWVKTGEKAGKFLSVQASEPRPARATAPAANAASGFDDDDIGF